MVELIVNGKSLELERYGNGIKYNIQIADVFDIASVSASYTNSFTIPKTPYNTGVFQQLGIVGDTSEIPYTRVPVTLKSNGFDVIPSGWLSVASTSDSYKVSIINGMIDFFKAIENKTMGKDLVLTDFDHEKNIDTVVNSFSNEFYKYLIADYNGKNIGILNDETSGINIDYLVPCFSVRKLWDLVFSTYGFTYNEAALSFLDGLYITYPKPPNEDSEPEIVAEASKGFYSVFNNQYTFLDWNGFKYTPYNEFWDVVVEGAFGNNWVYSVPEDGSYTFEINTEAYAVYRTAIQTGETTQSIIQPAIIALMHNGNIISAINTNPQTPVTVIFTEYFNEGDTIQVRILMTPTIQISGKTYTAYNIRHNSTVFKAYKLNLGDVSLSNAFEDFSIKDFIKEILWRTALTPVIDQYENYIDFIPLSYRLDFDNAIDWSNKYVRRTDETYTLSSYAQKNAFTLKHNNEDEMRGNGYLYVNNRNLPDEKTIVNSKIYAPEPLGFTFISVGESASFQTDVYRIWNREVKPDNAGGIDIAYKGLSNRFYFVRLNTVTASGVDSFRLVSEALQGEAEVSTVHYATNQQTLFDELVFTNYREYEGILYNVRIHKIELVLTERDIIELDLTKPYYFKQEGQYYILNRLPYEEGKTVIGEFVRINKI